MKKNNVLRWILQVVVMGAICMNLQAQEPVEGNQNSIVVKTLQETPELVSFNCPPFIPEGCMITVLQGDPAKGNFDILFRIPANFEVPKHWHSSPERMILISGTLEVTYDGEEPRILNAGDYAYGPAKKPHTAKCGDNGPCTLFIAFEEPLDAHEVKD